MKLTSRIKTLRATRLDHLSASLTALDKHRVFTSPHSYIAQRTRILSEIDRLKVIDAAGNVFMVHEIRLAKAMQ